MSETLGIRKNTVDAIVVGGGPVGLHTAHTLYETMGKNARLLAVTQEGEWGGLAGRSLEQYRMFNDSYAMAELVGKGIKMYDRVDEELQEQRSTTKAKQQFPYIFTVGSKERPEYINELLPEGTPARPDMEYYIHLKEQTESWGFDPQAQIVGAEYLRQQFPLLDGDGIRGAMIINNAGRLHFDVMRSWMMERSRADYNGRGVTYRAALAARKVLLGKSGEAIGVELVNEKTQDLERIYSDKIILTIGAFAVNLAQLLPGEESERIANNFTVTQRELFFANTPGVQDDTNFFLISPDMAIARVSTREGHASYGFAAEDDPVVAIPSKNPSPNRSDMFVGRTYALLAECSSRWDSDHPDRLALKPFGHSAGYYSAYRDDLPVVGKVGDTNVTIAIGSHHSGVMAGQGIAELAVDHVLGTQSISPKAHEQTNINRTPVEHTGLVL